MNGEQFMDRMYHLYSQREYDKRMLQESFDVVSLDVTQFYVDGLRRMKAKGFNSCSVLDRATGQEDFLKVYEAQTAVVTNDVKWFIQRKLDGIDDVVNEMRKNLHER